MHFAQNSAMTLILLLCMFSGFCAGFMVGVIAASAKRITDKLDMAEDKKFRERPCGW